MFYIKCSKSWSVLTSASTGKLHKYNRFKELFSAQNDPVQETHFQKTKCFLLQCTLQKKVNLNVNSFLGCADTKGVNDVNKCKISQFKDNHDIPGEETEERWAEGVSGAKVEVLLWRRLTEEREELFLHKL